MSKWLRSCAVLLVAAVACQAPRLTLPLPSFGPLLPQEVTLTVRALGPDGEVQRARVCATRPTEENVRCGVTDGSGTTTFRVRPGIYVIRGDPPQATRLRAMAIVSLEVAGDVSATLLYETRSILSGNVRDGQGRGVARAEVCAHPAGHDAVVCERSGADGAFAIDVPAGTYKLHFDGPPDGSRLIAQWGIGRVESFEADSFDTRTGDVSGIEVALVRGHVFSGTVRAARNGITVEEAQICTQTLSAPLPWACERTDEEGRFRTLREPGTYWVWVIPPDDAGRLLPQRYAGVDLGVDATPFVIDRDRALEVALRDGPLLTGRLSTDDGAPLPFALVCVDTPFPTGRICRPSDGNGSYSVALRPDVYTVQVVPTGDTDAVGSYHSRKRDWTEADRVDVSGDTRLDIVLPRGVRFSGTVRTKEGVPVEAAPVSLNDTRGFLLGTYTDRAGQYEIAVLPGRYTIDVFAPRVSQLVSRVGMPLEITGDIGLDVVLEFARP